MKALNERSVGGRPLQATPSPPPEAIAEGIRTRGRKGRDEAAERGIITGNGPSGGIVSNGKQVAVTGLPGRITADAMKDWLRSFKLADNHRQEKQVAKIDLYVLASTLQLKPLLISVQTLGGFW